MWCHLLGKAELAWLVKSLGMSKRDLVKPASFSERLKIQKAVSLLKHLGVEPFKGYTFGRYLRGPYAPELANDYYHLRGVKPTRVDLGENVETVKWFTSHSMTWLEVASSIISIKEQYPRMKEVEIYSLLLLSKPWVTRSQFKEIVGELKEKDLPR